MKLMSPIIGTTYKCLSSDSHLILQCTYSHPVFLQENDSTPVFISSLFVEPNQVITCKCLGGEKEPQTPVQGHVHEFTLLGEMHPNCSHV